MLSRRAGINAKAKVRLVQGSHIVVPRLYDHDHAYTFQNSDGRVVFVIPFQNDFTLIGTTDRDYDGDPSKVKASAEEIAYLCQSVNDYLAKQVTPADVVWAYAGVRPLYDDGASEAKAATRDYVFEFDTPGGLPLLSIFGGKITTYRRLSEEALERLEQYLPSKAKPAGWTATAPLPGGDLGVGVSCDSILRARRLEDLLLVFVTPDPLQNNVRAQRLIAVRIDDLTGRHQPKFPCRSSPKPASGLVGDQGDCRVYRRPPPCS